MAPTAKVRPILPQRWLRQRRIALLILVFAVLAVAIWFARGDVPVTSAAAGELDPTAGKGGKVANVPIPAPFQAAGCVPAPAGMVAWLPGDGNDIDFVTGQNAGGLAYAPGKVAQAFDIQGTHYMGLAHPSLDVGTGNGFTLDTWLKPAAISQKASLVAWSDFSHFSGNSTLGVHLWMSVTDELPGGVAGNLYLNVRDTSGIDHKVQSSGSVIAANTWQHIAVTYDRTIGNVAIYVDGSAIQLSSNNVGVFTPRTSFPLILGRRIDIQGGANQYTGQIDEFELFNRALTQSEIQSIFNAGSAGKCKNECPTTLNFDVSSATVVLAGDEFKIGDRANQPLTLLPNKPVPSVFLGGIIFTPANVNTPTGVHTGTVNQTITFDGGGSATLSRRLVYTVTSSERRISLDMGETKTVDLGARGKVDIALQENRLLSNFANGNRTVLVLPPFSDATYRLHDGPSGCIQFRVSNYDVQEACTFLTLTVDRTGDTSGAAQVDYASANGSSTERGDFITALGTLRFEAGETSKTFVVLINEDSYVEGQENFPVDLSNPINANLGAPSSTTVTINDDATEPATNIINNARNYVCQNYHDFLNRQPDTSGWDFWTAEITSCGNNAQCIETKRINVSAAFFLSIEFQQTGYLVERAHKTSYGDATGNSTFGGAHQLPVPVIRFREFLVEAQRIGRGVVVGQPGWEQQLEANKVAFFLEFVQRASFTTALPTGMTPAAFVNRLNQNAGNVLSASERTTAINLFAGAGNTTNTTARAQALRQVAEDQGLQTAEFNRAFVLMQYKGYLRRNPNDTPDVDYTGFDFWLTKLNQFNGNFGNAEMVKAFILSTEYRQRFGP